MYTTDIPLPVDDKLVHLARGLRAKQRAWIREHRECAYAKGDPLVKGIVQEAEARASARVAMMPPATRRFFYQNALVGGYGGRDGTFGLTHLISSSILTHIIHEECGLGVVDVDRFALRDLARIANPPPPVAGSLLALHFGRSPAWCPRLPWRPGEEGRDRMGLLVLPPDCLGFAAGVRFEEPVSCLHLGPSGWDTTQLIGFMFVQGPAYCSWGVPRFSVGALDASRAGEDGREDAFSCLVLPLVMASPLERASPDQGPSTLYPWRWDHRTEDLSMAGVPLPPLSLMGWIWRVLGVLWKENALLSTAERPDRPRPKKGPSPTRAEPVHLRLRVTEALDGVERRVIEPRPRQVEAPGRGAGVSPEEAPVAAVAPPATLEGGRAFPRRWVPEHPFRVWVREANASAEEVAQAVASGGCREGKHGTLYLVSRPRRGYFAGAEDAPQRRTTRVKLVGRSDYV